jgi:hypothetical protein
MTPVDPEALRAAFVVLDVLNDFEIPYHLGGSYASAIHGIPRQTHDIDLVVDLAPARIPSLARALEAEFHIDEQAAARAVAERSTFNLIHYASGVKVDLFVKGSSAFDAAEFDRRLTTRLGQEPSREVFVKSAEDTVLRKLLWYRMGDEVSDRQWEDVRGIVAIQGERLDRDYLATWAERLALRDLLERLLGND